MSYHMINLSIYQNQPVSLPISLSIHPPSHLSIYLLIYLFAYLSIIDITIHPSIHPSISALRRGVATRWICAVLHRTLGSSARGLLIFMCLGWRLASSRPSFARIILSRCRAWLQSAYLRRETLSAHCSRQTREATVHRSMLSCQNHHHALIHSTVAVVRK